MTERNQQNIYSWMPGDLTLITADGLGTISAIHFDDTSNNLYWIDPKNFVLKMMNLQNRLKVNLVSGNSSYQLVDFTLQTAEGWVLIIRSSPKHPETHYPSLIRAYVILFVSLNSLREVLSSCVLYIIISRPYFEILISGRWRYYFSIRTSLAPW